MVETNKNSDNEEDDSDRGDESCVEDEKEN